MPRSSHPATRVSAFLSSVVALAVAAVGALGACGDDCIVTPSSYQGSLVYGGILPRSLPTASDASDAGSTSASATTTGGFPLTVSVDAFSPSSDNGSGPGGYCGAKTFSIDLGPTCIVHGELGTVYYDSQERNFISAAAPLTADSSCAIPTPSGGLEMSIQSGVVHFAPGTVEVDVTGTSAISATSSLHFEGVSS